MKQLFLLLAFIMFGITIQAQECGSYVDLVGSGIAGESSASLIIDATSVDSIVVEAIYKSTTQPSAVRFWTATEEVFVEPVDVLVSGLLGSVNNDPIIASVYRTTLSAASIVNLDILQNTPEFFSFAAYVFSPSLGISSTVSGDLYHVYKNEDNPLVTNIPIPTSVNSRSITIRYGITELNNDERKAIFTFEADGTLIEKEVYAWDDGIGETESYTIQDVLILGVPGNVDKIIMTQISHNYDHDGTGRGDSWIGGRVIADIPCEKEKKDSALFCTYTQGFYGNKGGKTCLGETTPEIIARLLATDLVLGLGNNTFTISAGNVDDVLGILPGGGPSAVLNGHATYANPVGLNMKKGKLKNTLLAQSITFALNLRNNPDMLLFKLDPFTTQFPMDCSSIEAGGIPGSEKEFKFSQAIVDYLGDDATIGDLLDLVNLALSGGDIGTLSLSNVSDAATLVNEAFDECVYVTVEAEEEIPEVAPVVEVIEEDEGTEEDGGTKGTTGINDIEAGSFSLYPNPVGDQMFINLSPEIRNVKTISMYNVTGATEKILTDNFNANSIQIDVSDLNEGMYFLRIDADTGTVVRRFTVN